MSGAQDGREKRPKLPHLEHWLDEVVAWGQRRRVDISFYKSPYGVWTARLHFKDSAGFFVYSAEVPDPLTWPGVDGLHKELDRISATARKARRMSRNGVALVHSSNGWGLALR